MKLCPFNPLDESNMADPWKLYAEARDAQVSEIFPGMVFVADYELARQVFLDTDRFSSEWMPDGVMGLGDNPQEERPFGMMDPPRHTPFRRLALEALNGRAVKAEEEWLADRCRRFLDDLIGQETIELVSEYGTHIPSAGITHLLGLGEEHAADLGHWTHQFAENSNLMKAFMGEEGDGESRRHLESFHAFLKQEMDDRRANPGRDDLLSRMMTYTDPEGVTFTDLELRTQLQFLLMAGYDTTRSFLANAFHAVATDPELFQRLRAEPDIAADITEEVLRYYSPVQMIFRMAREDTTIGGHQIQEGTMIVLGLASAGREEETIPDADVFDIDRKPLRNHLSMGMGTHFCVGKNLAKLEVKLALQALADRFETITPVEGYVYRRGGCDPISVAPESVEITYTLADAAVASAS